MDELISELCDILEITELPMDARFEDLPEWDSLNALSVIALLESNYEIEIDAERLQKFASIMEFSQYVLAGGK